MPSDRRFPGPTSFSRRSLLEVIRRFVQGDPDSFAAGLRAFGPMQWEEVGRARVLRLSIQDLVCRPRQTKITKALHYKRLLWPAQPQKHAIH